MVNKAVKVQKYLMEYICMISTVTYIWESNKNGYFFLTFLMNHNLIYLWIKHFSKSKLWQLKRKQFEMFLYKNTNISKSLFLISFLRITNYLIIRPRFRHFRIGTEIWTTLIPFYMSIRRVFSPAKVSNNEVDVIEVLTDHTTSNNKFDSLKSFWFPQIAL